MSELKTWNILGCILVTLFSYLYQLPLYYQPVFVVCPSVFSCQKDVDEVRYCNAVNWPENYQFRHLVSELYRGNNKD